MISRISRPPAAFLRLFVTRSGTRLSIPAALLLSLAIILFPGAAVRGEGFETEDGFYTFDGKTRIISEASHSGSQVNGTDWVAVASEDEWYKAAYYDGNGGYYDYPTESDTAPTAEGPPGGTNSANYNTAVASVTEVGDYPNSGSHYGTFDQGGNVDEWNDEIISSSRGLRGGSFLSFGSTLRSSERVDLSPTDESFLIGFRVSSLAPIPEPSSYGAIFGIVGLATAVFFRRRRRRE